MLYMALNLKPGAVKELFTKVTGHFAIEKKGVDKSILDFSEAPKMFISSNSSPKGFSSSFQRRLHLLEFSDHYNLEHTPSDEFGDKDFFSDDWNQDDYNAIYSFLIRCIQIYLDAGIHVSKSASDIKYKQLISHTGREFAEYWVDRPISEFVNGFQLFE